MKIKEIKHNHSLTDLLKVILFSILMILPFLSVASRCLYVINNKNAKDSYSGTNESIYQDTLVTNIDNLQTNNTYLFDSFNYSIDSQSNLGAWSYSMNITNLKILNSNFVLNQPQENVKAFSIYFNTSYNGRAQLQFTYNDDVSQTFNQTQNFRFLFTYLSDNFNVNWAQYDLFYSVIFNDKYYLDNAFEYSVNKLEDNNLFNWTENTGVYTGVKAMTDNLQIDMPVIPMIITYWFLLTVIYIIIDLIVKAFTTLTHMVIKKTT